MAGFNTANSTHADHLIRSEVWSTELKQILEDELLGMKYVKMLTEFPDGENFNIPSVGQAVVSNYVEDMPIHYTAMDTGLFQFAITDYIHSATYITNKMLQDSYVAAQILGQFVPKQRRAIMEYIEGKILGLSAQQTAGNSNTINGAKHRWVASGTNEVMELKDFALAKFALKKANVPEQNLVAIVDPSVEYRLSTLTNLTSLDSNPRWEGIIETGIASGMRFLRNIYGFDVYVSNYLADANETIDGRTSAAGKANMFFSAAPDVLPFVGAMRQAPKVDSEYNKDLQREEYVTTCRFGFKLYRPENLVVVISDTDQVS